jgi:hypothetical protein
MSGPTIALLHTSQIEGPTLADALQREGYPVVPFIGEADKAFASFKEWHRKNTPQLVIVGNLRDVIGSVGQYLQAFGLESLHFGVTPWNYHEFFPENHWMVWPNQADIADPVSCENFTAWVKHYLPT